MVLRARPARILALAIGALAALPLMLTACGGSRYLVVTDNYTTYISDSKPKTSDDGASVTMGAAKAMAAAPLRSAASTTCSGVVGAVATCQG